MNTSDYTATLLVGNTPEEAFKTINRISEWWSADMKGLSGQLNDVFTVRFGEVFITSEVVEFIPGKKIAWLVIDCNKPWLKNTKEWKGTKMSWEISKMDHKTEIRFTHLGLAPDIECFEVCSNAWSGYLQGSLFKLLTGGKGRPS